MMGSWDKLIKPTSKILQYNKALAQRNALFKYFVANQTFDQETLSIYDEQLIQLGTTIYRQAKKLLRNFIPIVKNHYKSISKV